MLTSWLHLTALALYLGSVAGLWVILLPSLSAIRDHQGRLQLLAAGLKLYNPVQIGMLGLLVISGAFLVTDLKAAYREMFVRELGTALALKLALSFVLVVLSSYQSMALAHRFVRRFDGGEPCSPQELGALAGRLKASSLSILFLVLVVLWLGVRLRG